MSHDQLIWEAIERLNSMVCTLANSLGAAPGTNAAQDLTRLAKEVDGLRDQYMLKEAR